MTLIISLDLVTQTYIHDTHITQHTTHRKHRKHTRHVSCCHALMLSCCHVSCHVSCIVLMCHASYFMYHISCIMLSCCHAVTYVCICSSLWPVTVSLSLGVLLRCVCVCLCVSVVFLLCVSVCVSVVVCCVLSLVSCSLVAAQCDVFVPLPSTIQPGVGADSNLVSQDGELNTRGRMSDIILTGTSALRGRKYITIYAYADVRGTGFITQAQNPTQVKLGVTMLGPELTVSVPNQVILPTVNGVFTMTGTNLGSNYSVSFGSFPATCVPQSVRDQYRCTVLGPGIGSNLALTVTNLQTRRTKILEAPTFAFSFQKPSITGTTAPATLATQATPTFEFGKQQHTQRAQDKGEHGTHGQSRYVRVSR